MDSPTKKSPVEEQKKFYKAFNQDLTCRGFQYEVGQTYYLNEPLKICQVGFHACTVLADCLVFYPFDSRFCIVTLGENYITEGNKTVSNEITIVEEIFPDKLINPMNEETAYYDANGKLHRDNDEPAVEETICKQWWHHGLLHRDNDKPAIEFCNGSKEWFKNGLRHRDGDQPAVVHSNGYTAYYQHNKLHRDGDKPAVEFASGHKEWWQHGQLHREGDMPAVNSTIITIGSNIIPI